MKNLIFAFRSLFKKRYKNIIKIVSLAAGLSVGLVLLSKVFFEKSYDNFYPDIERVYRIHQEYYMGDEHDTGYQTSGGVALGFQADVAGVEVATRFISITRSKVIADTETSYRASLALADSNYFKVLPRPVVIGNPHEILKNPMSALVSDEFAAKLNGDPLGQSFELETYPGRRFNIGGIFEKYPRNSSVRFDVIASLASIDQFTWDGTENWYGNDRYQTFVKLHRGVDPKSLRPTIELMMEKWLPWEELNEDGLKMDFTINPYSTYRQEDEGVKRMNTLLLILALSLLSAAVFNYIIIVLSNAILRAKEIATYKCYGATRGDIAKMIFTETGLHVIIAMLLATLLIFTFRGTILDLLGYSLQELFSVRTILMLLGLCLGIFLVSGYIPSRMYGNIPVLSVFRGQGVAGSIWKKILLLLQFAGAAFLCVLLVIIIRQYNTMMNKDLGYNFENIVYYRAVGSDYDKMEVALDALRQLPQVEMVSNAYNLPMTWPSGNHVKLTEKGLTLFNYADLYGSDENYLDIFDMKLVEGAKFDRNTSDHTMVMVSRSFAQRVSEAAGWTDGIVGKHIYMGDDGYERIVIGVYEDYIMGSAAYNDKRPSALSYTDKANNLIFVRLNALNYDNINSIRTTLAPIFNDKDVVVEVYRDQVTNAYRESLKFRNSVLIGAIITLLIVFAGLIGYLNNEIHRRQAEIAIRKVNGARISEILRLFLRDIYIFAIPSFVGGLIAAYYIGKKWMMEYAVKATLPLWLFIACFAVMIIVISIVVVTNSLRAAMRNPVDSLKSE